MERPDRAFGNSEGIQNRLCYWANQLSRDKAYPWVGTGLLDDLKCAAKLLGADCGALFPAHVEKPKPPAAPPPPPPVVEDWEILATKPKVFDL